MPATLLPDVRASSEVHGRVSMSMVSDIPIAGVAGDQQAALFGQMCRQLGMSKNACGTGWLSSAEYRHDAARRPGHQLRDNGRVEDRQAHRVHARGSVFISGAVVQWIRDGLQLVRTAAEIEPLAASVADNGGVYLVPAFAGLGAPHWDPFARGAIVGITRGTTAGHLARAALESIAFQVSDLLDAMSADSGIALTELRVDGGAATNNTLMQFQADLLGVPVVRPAITETTALGAAYLAGLAVGFWGSVDEITGQWQVDRQFRAEDAAPRRARAPRTAGLAAVAR